MKYLNGTTEVPSCGEATVATRRMSAGAIAAAVVTDPADGDLLERIAFRSATGGKKIFGRAVAIAKLA